MKLRGLAVVLLITGGSGICGYFVAPRTTDPQVRSLQAELERAHSRIEELERQIRLRLRAAVRWREQESKGRPESVIDTNGVTSRDIEQTLAKQRQHDNGEYVLESERPVSTKLRAASLERIMTGVMSNKIPLYEGIFKQFGVDDATGYQLGYHAAKIHEASLGAELAIQDLLLARHSYDERIKSLLSPNDYNRYLEIEANGSAQREYGLMKDYLREKQIAIDPSSEASIIGLMRSEGAYSHDYWHGPYDGLPRVAIGESMVGNQLENEIADLTERSQSLVGKARELGVDDTVVGALTDYYNYQLDGKRRTLDNVKNVRSAPLPKEASAALARRAGAK